MAMAGVKEERTEMWVGSAHTETQLHLLERYELTHSKMLENKHRDQQLAKEGALSTFLHFGKFRVQRMTVSP